MVASVSFATAQNLTRLCAQTNGSNCIPDGGASAKVLSTASTNSNLISTGGHILYDAVAVNTNATTAYLKFYDKATAPTCASDTVLATIPLPQNVAMPINSLVGKTFTLGLGLCITGGIADSDNTNATTGIAVNLTYK